MKKCEKLLDYLECNDVNENSKTWLDIKEHAKKCPDCSVDLELRLQISKALDESSDIAYPYKLHDNIMQSIEIGEDYSEPTPFEQFIGNLLVPLQYAFVAVSIYLFISLSSLPIKTQIAHPAFHKHGFSVAGSIAKLQTIQPAKPEQLAKVSPEEVKDFLKKLNEYKRLHPEINKGYKTDLNKPLLELASY